MPIREKPPLIPLTDQEILIVKVDLDIEGENTKMVRSNHRVALVDGSPVIRKTLRAKLPANSGDCQINFSTHFRATDWIQCLYCPCLAGVLKNQKSSLKQAIFMRSIFESPCIILCDRYGEPELADGRLQFITPKKKFGVPDDYHDFTSKAIDSPDEEIRKIANKYVEFRTCMNVMIKYATYEKILEVHYYPNSDSNHILSKLGPDWGSGVFHAIQIMAANPNCRFYEDDDFRTHYPTTEIKGTQWNFPVEGVDQKRARHHMQLHFLVPFATGTPKMWGESLEEEIRERKVLDENERREEENRYGALRMHMQAQQAAGQTIEQGSQNPNERLARTRNDPNIVAQADDDEGGIFPDDDDANLPMDADRPGAQEEDEGGSESDNDDAVGSDGEEGGDDDDDNSAGAAARTNTPMAAAPPAHNNTDDNNVGTTASSVSRTRIRLKLPTTTNGATLNETDTAAIPSEESDDEESSISSSEESTISSSNSRNVQAMAEAAGATHVAVVDVGNVDPPSTGVALPGAGDTSLGCGSDPSLPPPKNNSVDPLLSTVDTDVQAVLFEQHAGKGKARREAADGHSNEDSDDSIKEELKKRKKRAERRRMAGFVNEDGNDDSPADDTKPAARPSAEAKENTSSKVDSKVDGGGGAGFVNEDGNDDPPADDTKPAARPSAKAKEDTSSKADSKVDGGGDDGFDAHDVAAEEGNLEDAAQADIPSTPNSPASMVERIFATPQKLARKIGRGFSGSKSKSNKPTSASKDPATMAPPNTAGCADDIDMKVPDLVQEENNPIQDAPNVAGNQFDDASDDENANADQYFQSVRGQVSKANGTPKVPPPKKLLGKVRNPIKRIFSPKKEKKEETKEDTKLAADVSGTPKVAPPKKLLGKVGRALRNPIKSIFTPKKEKKEGTKPAADVSKPAARPSAKAKEDTPKVDSKEDTKEASINPAARPSEDTNKSADANQVAARPSPKKDTSKADSTEDTNKPAARPSAKEETSKADAIDDNFQRKHLRVLGEEPGVGSGNGEEKEDEEHSTQGAGGDHLVPGGNGGSGGEEKEEEQPSNNGVGANGEYPALENGGMNGQEETMDGNEPALDNIAQSAPDFLWLIFVIVCFLVVLQSKTVYKSDRSSTDDG